MVDTAFWHNGVVAVMVAFKGAVQEQLFTITEAMAVFEHEFTSLKLYVTV